MSYIDQENGSRRVAIGGVVLLHIAVGYALISGFAINVITHTSPPTLVGEYPDDTVPPPRDNPPPPKRKVAHDDPVIPDTIIKVDVGTGGTILTKPIQDVYPPFRVMPDPQPEPPKITTHARAPIPGPGRAGWVTTDDYPPSALRDEVQGIVGIGVTVGADGRVSACSVTASSGSDVLDQATCRLYSRRARFQSALDDDGKATIGQYADRIRWTIPAQ